MNILATVDLAPVTDATQAASNAALAQIGTLLTAIFAVAGVIWTAKSLWAWFKSMAEPDGPYTQYDKDNQTTGGNG